MDALEQPLEVGETLSIRTGTDCKLSTEMNWRRHASPSLTNCEEECRVASRFGEKTLLYRLTVCAQGRSTGMQILRRTACIAAIALLLTCAMALNAQPDSIGRPAVRLLGDTVVVEWTRPAGDVNDYRVQWNLVDEPWNTGGSAYPTEPRYEISGLRSGLWEVRVRGRRAAGSGNIGGPWSLPSQVEIPTRLVPCAEIVGLLAAVVALVGAVLGLVSRRNRRKSPA